MELTRSIGKLVAPLKRRVQLMVGRCVLLAVNDKSDVQQLQVRALADELLDKVERFQEYGFTSHPKPGAEGALVCVGGQRGHAIVIAVEDKRYRIKGTKSGEVAMYDDQGQVVHLKRDGMEVSTDRPQGVKVKAPKVYIESEEILFGDGDDPRPVARIGDKVRITSGSSAGLNGIIETGSTIATCA